MVLCCAVLRPVSLLLCRIMGIQLQSLAGADVCLKAPLFHLQHIIS